MKTLKSFFNSDAYILGSIIILVIVMIVPCFLALSHVQLPISADAICSIIAIAFINVLLYMARTF